MFTCNIEFPIQVKESKYKLTCCCFFETEAIRTSTLLLTIITTFEAHIGYEVILFFNYTALASYEKEEEILSFPRWVYVLSNQPIASDSQDRIEPVAGLRK